MDNRDRLFTQEGKETAQQRLEEAVFREYLKDFDPASELPDMEIPIPADIYPVTVCTVYLKKDPSVRIPPLKEMFCDLFPAGEGIYALSMRPNELLCVIGDKVHFPEQEDIHSKLTELKMQIKRASSVAPLITYVKDMQNLQEVKRYYRICVHTYKRSFYQHSISPLQLFPGGLPDHYFPAIQAEFMEQIIACFRENRRQELYGYIDQFIKDCAARCIDHSLLTNCLSNMIWCIYAFNALPVTVNTVKLFLAQIKYSQSATELETQLMAFLSNLTEETPTAPAFRHEIQEAISYIQTFYMKKLTLEELAAHVNLNREYFSRLFRAQTGTTVSRYILDLRMQKAAELLEQQKYILIKDVANAVGIPDPYAFSKRFKAYYGVSPSEYPDT